MEPTRNTTKKFTGVSKLLSIVTQNSNSCNSPIKRCKLNWIKKKKKNSKTQVPLVSEKYISLAKTLVDREGMCFSPPSKCKQRTS